MAELTFTQTTEVIRNADILLCCDGGLMHSANSVSTPIVPLFAGLTEKMQLTEPILSFPLFDKNDVNNILVEDILKKFNEATIYVHSRPQAL